MTDTPIRAGLIGFGLAGTAFHAPLIAAAPELELAAIATSRADQVHASYPQAAVTDVDTLLADPEIALVAVATPNDSHAPLARRALEAGKHVVVDKPFVLDREEGEALIALARSKGLVLSVFHNRRWDGDFLTVRSLLASGRLGEVALAELRWDRFRPAIKSGWREEAGEGGGILADLGPHLIDQALSLFGEPEAVNADVAIQREGAAVDDYFELTLHYGARRVILGTSTLVAAPRPRFALHGTRGSFVKYGIDPQEATLRAGGTPNDSGYGEDDPLNYGRLTHEDATEILPTERGDWRNFYAGVALAIRESEPVPVDPRDALAGLRLIELARQSAAEGRTLVFS